MNWRIWTFSSVGGRIFLAADSSREQLQSVDHSVKRLASPGQQICGAHLQASLDVKGRPFIFKEHKPGWGAQHPS